MHTASKQTMRTANANARKSKLDKGSEPKPKAHTPELKLSKKKATPRKTARMSTGRGVCPLKVSFLNALLSSRCCCLASTCMSHWRVVSQGRRVLVPGEVFKTPKEKYAGTVTGWHGNSKKDCVTIWFDEGDKVRHPIQQQEQRGSASSTRLM